MTNKEPLTRRSAACYCTCTYPSRLPRHETGWAGGQDEDRQERFQTVADNPFGEVEAVSTMAHEFDMKSKFSKSVATFLIVSGLSLGSVGVVGAQDSNGNINFDNTTDQTSDQDNDVDQDVDVDQDQSGDQFQLVEQDQDQTQSTNGDQTSDQDNSLSGSSSSSTGFNDDEGDDSYASGDSASSSSIGNTNQANSTRQDQSNDGSQNQDADLGDQFNNQDSDNTLTSNPTNDNDQTNDSDQTATDIGGDDNGTVEIDIDAVDSEVILLLIEELEQMMRR